MHEVLSPAPYSEESMAFYQWGEKLAGESNGDFLLIDLNDPELVTDRAEFIDLERAYYPSSEMGSTLEGHNDLKKLLYEIAGKILAPGEFEKLVETFRADPALMERTREIWLDGGNTASVTNHKRIADIALIQAAKYCAVDTPGYAEKSLLVVNKAVGFLDFVLNKDEDGKPVAHLPAIKVMQLFSNVATTVPRSKSLDKPELQILKKFGDNFNRKFIPVLKNFADEGGGEMTIAASASVDDDETEPGILKMKVVEDIVAKLIQRYTPNTSPVMLYVKDGLVNCYVGPLRKVMSPEDVHSLMEEMIPPYQDAVGDAVTVKYIRPLS